VFVVDTRLDIGRGRAGLFQYLRHEAVLLQEQREKQMLYVYLLVPEPDGHLAGGLHRLLCLLCKFIHIHG
jgi:hypothetical protein